MVREGGRAMSAILQIERTGERAVRVSGELDLATSDDLGEAIGDLVERGGPIDLDMSGVTFIDSTGILRIVSSAESLTGRGKITLRQPSHFVVRVLELMGLLPVPSGLALSVEPATDR